jgi:hypothetical protein
MKNEFNPMKNEFNPTRSKLMRDDPETLRSSGDPMKPDCATFDDSPRARQYFPGMIVGYLAVKSLSFRERKWSLPPGLEGNRAAIGLQLMRPARAVVGEGPRARNASAR